MPWEHAKTIPILGLRSPSTKLLWSSHWQPGIRSPSVLRLWLVPEVNLLSAHAYCCTRLSTLQAFAIQGYVTGEGPYANFVKHVSDPFG